jgi:hypothetical protein
MNQLEVGKVYTTQAGEKIEIVSRRETAGPSCEFLGQTVGKIHTTYYSLHGIARDEFSGLNIARPVEFRSGQLVMARDRGGQDWSVDIFQGLVFPKVIDMNFQCKSTVWRYCRHPTDEEWLELREGKK